MRRDDAAGWECGDVDIPSGRTGRNTTIIEPRNKSRKEHSGRLSLRSTHGSTHVAGVAAPTSRVDSTESPRALAPSHTCNFASPLHRSPVVPLFPFHATHSLLLYPLATFHIPRFTQGMDLQYGLCRFSTIYLFTFCFWEAGILPWFCAGI